MTNEEIIQRGQLINDETEPAQNTSERVGGVIKGIGQNLADKDTAIAAEAARNGYYQCTVSDTTLAVTAPGFTLPAHGGNIRIKMSAPATGASTLNINSTGPKTLLYNGAAVTSANTWEKDEIISVFYDPSGSGQYLASNSQGGGGKAEKIKYNNSQSGLAAENVQEALDELKDEVTVHGDNLIDMSTMGADTTSTTYLTVTKDVENNGVIFNVVRHNNSSPFGRIYQMHLVAGKTYRLSFEYINTAYQTAPGFRNSSNTYIHSDISYITMPINTEYKAFTCMFVAPDNVYYLAFTNLTNGAAGGSLTIRNFNLVEVNTIIEKVSELDANIEQLQEDVENIDNIKTQPLIRIPYYASQAVRTDAGHEGELINRSGCGHSNYTPLYGAKKIYVLAPALGTSNVGIAFYCREAQTSCCGVIGFVHYTGVQESLWKMYDVPEGANFFRMTLYTDIASQYQVVVPLDYLVDLSNLSLQSIIGTHIMRSAVQISEKKYIYAFGAPQYPIIGYKAYVSYGANENTVDGDMIDYPNDSCMAIVDLFDLSHEVLYPINGTKQKADGTPANNAVIGYITSCATPQGSIASFGLMRFNDKNPYYCYSIMDVESISSLEPVDGKISPVKNWTTCRLSYNGNTVDFTVNNYRQMLVDMGYASSYIASTTDAVDNINLHYDKTEGIYYAVLCGSVASSQVLPIVLMQSTDMATWSPKAYLGIKDTANEIEAIYKNGVVYVVYRTANAGMKYIVYNTSNITMLSSGIFPTSKDMLSKPDVFTFGNNVYMALNIDPSIYGELTNYNNYYLDARQEIAIYKVVNGVPKLFRRVNNPTGIDYFAFTETPPMYATQSSANPMYAQGAIYIAFSEDKRHLYRRQIAQVSFADVTALFADFGRIV